MALTSVAAAVVLALMLDDLHPRRLGLSLDLVGGLVIGSCYALAALAPRMLRHARPSRVRVRFEEDGLVIGEERVRADDVHAVSVARGARGMSVALVADGRVRFLELEDEASARAIAGALRSDGVAHAAVPRVASPRRLASWQAVLTMAILALGALHLAAAFGAASSEVKFFAGVATVLLAQLATFAVVTRTVTTTRLATEQEARGTSRGSASAWEAHVLLHARAAERTPGTSSGGDEAPRASAPDVLARVDEPTAAWLTRLDALPHDACVYRGDAVSRDVLMTTLADEAAPSHARIAAARLLARRFGEPEPALVRMVEDPDVRLRVEAVQGDVEDAVERLDALGPIFRAG